MPPSADNVSCQLIYFEISKTAIPPKNAPAVRRPRRAISRLGAGGTLSALMPPAPALLVDCLRVPQHQWGDALGKNDEISARETSAGYDQAVELKKIRCRGDRLGRLIFEGVIARDLDPKG